MTVNHGHSQTPSQRRPIEPRFLSLDDVAIYLAISKRQVTAHVRSGELSGMKIGGRGTWRVDRQRLEDYIEGQREETQRWIDEHPWAQYRSDNGE